MLAALSREQVRELDRLITEECHVPSLVLMENAGRGAAEIIERELGGNSALGSRRVVVICGPGNNGGDGFVVARRLCVRGASVQVFLSANPDDLAGDARINYEAWRGVGGRVSVLDEISRVADLEKALSEADAAVDALLGTGLHRNVEGLLAEIVEALNQANVRRFALDIPSGLHANTGSPLKAAVVAHHTITFGHLKLGLLSSRGAAHAGRVEVVDLGVPASISERVGRAAGVIQAEDLMGLIAPRSIAEHKGSAGRVVAVAGSAGKSGAALLLARGALRAGAGLVTICTFPEAAAALDQRVLEEMTARIDPNRIEASLDERLANADVVAIGPGLGLDELARAVVDHVVLRWNGFKVVDADAITHFKDRAQLLRTAPGHIVLTPHPGELGRLLGIDPKEVERDRFAALGTAVELTGAVVLLKGPRTLIAGPNAPLPWINVEASAALATAGAGDVLSGILAALGCTMDPVSAAYAAAYIHGRAAARWAERSGVDRGLLAHEVADEVPAVIAALTASHPKMPV